MGDSSLPYNNGEFLAGGNVHWPRWSRLKGLIEVRLWLMVTLVAVCDKGWIDQLPIVRCGGRCYHSVGPCHMGGSSQV